MGAIMSGDHIRDSAFVIGRLPQTRFKQHTINHGLQFAHPQSMDVLRLGEQIDDQRKERGGKAQ